MPLIGPPQSGPTSPMPNILDPGRARTLDHLNAKYDVGDVIGTGAFSEVRKATERATGVQFAVKVIDKAKCKGKESMIQSEVAILSRVKHRNVIRLFEMYESPTKIYLIMEIVTGGELFDRIVARGFYTEADAAKLVCEILLGVRYLHSLNICHRDLKPENLLFYDASPTSRIMISDFGLSKIFSDEQVMRTACGTPGYVAPEVLRREIYTKQVDMWSIGVITYILLCGYPPFYEENNHALFQQIMRGEYEFDSPYWDNISFEAKNFVARLLVVDPKMRMTAEEALNHTFLVNNCAEALALARGMSHLHLNESGSLSLSRRHAEQSNLAPAIHDNLRNYTQRRSSDKLTAKYAAAEAVAAVAAANAAAAAAAAATRSNPALAASGSSGTSSLSSTSYTEPGMTPLRPKTEHRDVDDSGLVASNPDVRRGSVPATAVASILAATAPPRSPAAMDVDDDDECSESEQYYSTMLPPGTVPGLPAPVPSSPTRTQTQTRTVKFLSYSIFMRVPGVKNLNHSDHKNARLHHFIEHVLPEYDVVCLQEMYAYGSSRVTRLLQLAKQQGFHWAVTSPSKGLLNGCTDGGLVVLSRYEIVRQSRIAYKRSAYNCRFVSKGALYVKVKLADGQHVHLFNTNLQKSAGHDLTMHSPEVLVRQTQLAQLRAFVAQMTADRLRGEPVLVVGDFNLNGRARVSPSTGGSPTRPASPAAGMNTTEEYRQMMHLLRGDFGAVTHARVIDEFLGSDRDRVPLKLMDLLYVAYGGAHPVTYGDVVVDAHGKPLAPAETVLTDRADQGACHCVDYALWSPPEDGGVGVDLAPHGAVGVPKFVVEGGGETEFTHLSDHYGVEVVLRSKC
ncbi:hypothetical protein H9P43_002678 [Blastocladiella emersonii ATCC 22665]|nr:hypothetical protein H9P43_002678 [Blastocladiella emersonii ATCC 22665]